MAHNLARLIGHHNSHMLGNYMNNLLILSYFDFFTPMQGKQDVELMQVAHY
jgi:hypothetical protein